MPRQSRSNLSTGAPRTTIGHGIGLGVTAICLVALTAVEPARFAGAANSPAGPAARSVLHLTNDGFVTGDLCDSTGRTGIRWQSPAFTTPFEFSLSGINAVHFPVPARIPTASGEYCFELQRGDIVFGSIIAWTGDDLVVDLTRIGRVHVSRSDLLRFYRWRESAGIVYQGPQGLAGWQVAGTASPWREEFGQLVAEKEGVIRRNLGLPARSMIELEMSWKKKPDFSLALGVGDDEQSARPAFSFEVWGSELAVAGLIVLRREMDGTQRSSSCSRHKRERGGRTPGVGRLRSPPRAREEPNRHRPKRVGDHIGVCLLGEVVCVS